MMCGYSLSIWLHDSDGVDIVLISHTSLLISLWLMCCNRVFFILIIYFICLNGVMTFYLIMVFNLSSIWFGTTFHYIIIFLFDLFLIWCILLFNVLWYSVWLCYHAKHPYSAPWLFSLWSLFLLLGFLYFISYCIDFCT